MATGKDIAAVLTEQRDLIAEQNLTRLDLDDLRLQLTHAADLLIQCDSAAHDLALLRDDYQARIAGMLKAIAVSERTNRNYESLVDLVASLDALSADELIRTYKRTAAIFRDRFPGAITLPSA